jgi:ribonucleoside-diphosphate reductase beta chain
MSALRFDDWDLPSAAAQPNATVAPKKQTKTEIEPVLPADGAPARAAYLAPINAADKRIVNGKADINQLAPFKYPWAWEFFLKANRNHWTPLEIGMAQDVHDYHHKLSAAERHVFENVLAYLTTSDILAMRNIGLAVMEKMSAPELQIYQARQVYEEALHTWTYQHCIESLGLDQQEIYNRYRVVPEIHGKIALANRRLEKVLRSDFDLDRPRQPARIRAVLLLLRGDLRRLLVLQRLHPRLRAAAARPDEGRRRAAAVHHARRGAALRLRHPRHPRTADRGEPDPRPAGPARTVG